jgi:hypothetical protein
MVRDRPSARWRNATVIIAVSFVTGMIAGWFLARWVEVDRCLDRGGAFVYENRICAAR